MQRHIQILSKCKIFAPARTKKVRKKALISVLSMHLSLKWQYISHMFLVSLCASLRSENDRLIRLWLRCEISIIYTAKFYFNTQANFWMKFSFSSHVKKECKQVLVKNSPNKKGYIGFVGSQPMLLLFDACLNIWCKSNNIGCDPTNPMYPFLFGEFFY